MKKNIDNGHIKKFDDYIKAFINRYGFDYTFEVEDEEHKRYFAFLIKFDEEKGESINEKTMRIKLIEVKEKLELAEFENKLNSSNEDLFTIKDIDLMSGYEFEYFLKNLFNKMGYNVENTQLSGDQGADLVVKKFSEKIVIQAKRFNDKVSNKAIQEVVASIRHYRADRGMVVTNSEFTASAIQLAKSNRIELIDRDKLQNFIEKYF